MKDVFAIVNADIRTLDPACPRAAAMLVRDGRVADIRPDLPAAAALPSGVPTIDLRGRVVLPGFHDCHLHLLWFARLLATQADLVGAASVEEVLDRLRAFARRGDGWIVGHGFDQDKLRERRFPTRAELDRVSAVRPILATRVCGHAAVVNSAALGAVAADARRRGDEASGLYAEDAIAPFHRAVPTPDDGALESALLEAMSVARRAGITAVQTLLDTPDQMRIYARLERRLGRLPVRVVGMPSESSAEALFEHGILSGFGDEWLRVGGLKFFADGSLGARTALLSAPYADDPSATGQRLYPPAALRDRCRALHRMGFQLVIHAIGDAALDETLDAIEFALDGEANAPRHRVEHASVCRPDQVQRLARLGIAVTLQPQFITSDTWTGQRLGPQRAGWAYPFRALLDAGVRCGLSSDCPVERLDAGACLYAATQRHAWSPHGRLGVEEAIAAYCQGSAALAGREGELGTLAPGRAADFIVLGADPLTMPPDALRTLPVEQVCVGGDVAPA